jgi:hypothetical protein
MNLPKPRPRLFLTPATWLFIAERTSSATFAEQLAV